MVSGYTFEFRLPGTPYLSQLNRMLYRLVADGVRYNAGEYEGTYIVIPDDYSKEHRHREDDLGDRTERLGEILQIYDRFSPHKTHLSIGLAYIEPESPVPFHLRVAPYEDVHLLKFWTHDGYLDTEERFLSFVELLESLFERFDFPYGTLRWEDQRGMPSHLAALPELNPRAANFFGPEAVEVLGREWLLDAPTYRTDELDDGSLVLLTTPLAGDGEYWDALNRLQDYFEAADS